MNIVDWHTALKLPATETEIGKRAQTIDIIIKQGDIAFWQDLIKLYFGKNAADSTTNYLVDTFVNQGCEVPRSKNEKLLQNLSGMILVSRLQSAISEKNTDNKNEEDKGEDVNEIKQSNEKRNSINRLIGYSIINYNFFELEKISSKIPLLAKAGEYLSLSRAEEKMLAFPDLQKLTSIEKRLHEEGESFSEAESIEVVQYIKNLQESTIILSEELNILWWLQGEFSTVVNKYFVELGYSNAIVIASLELALLSIGGHSIQSASNILHKILYISNDRKHLMELISIKSCIDGLDENMKNILLKDFNSEIDIFTPCMLALKKSLTSKNWSSELGSKVDTPVHPSIISLQFYREFVYLKSINCG